MRICSSSSLEVLVHVCIIFVFSYLSVPSYWDPTFDDDLLEDRIAMNLLYVQVSHHGLVPGQGIWIFPCLHVSACGDFLTV